MIVRYLIHFALLAAGLMGITMSMPLEAPAVILLGLASVVVGVTLCADTEGGRDQKIGSSKRLFLVTAYLSLAATLYFVARAWYSPIRDLGMEDLMLILPAALLYFLAGYVVKGKSAIALRQGMAWAVVVLLLCHLISSAMQLQGGDGFSVSRYFSMASRSSEGRVSGMYGYYGSFANFAVIAGLLCLSLGVWGRVPSAGRVVLVLLGLMSLTLAVWSQSRSAALSLVITLIVFAVLLAVSLGGQGDAIKKWGRISLFVLGVFGLGISVAGGMWVFRERAGTEGLSAGDTAFDSAVRMPVWSMAAEQWVDHPLVGAGSRSFSYESFRYWSPNLPTGTANPRFVHNEYLQLLSDYGLIGFLFVVALLGLHLFMGGGSVYRLSSKVGKDGLSKGSNAMALAIAGVCGMVAMAVHIIFDFRTHLLANLLLFVCCAVWVLPVGKKGGLAHHMLAGLSLGRVLARFGLVMFGLSAMALGGYQLWGGLPLLENRMAKEDGTWRPESVPRGIWIPVLEESAARVPHYVRYQRLGTLYRLEAVEHRGEDRLHWMQKAQDAYLSSVDRHPHNPVPLLNLASIYMQKGEYSSADQAYAKASPIAIGRERWFRMHSEWAKLHKHWGEQLAAEKKFPEAEKHYRKAKELFKRSYDSGKFYQNKQWNVEYVNLLMTYARMLDSQKRFSDAEALYQEGRKQVNWHNWQTDTALNFYYAQHLYERGYATWMKRQPDEALKLMLQAKSCLLNYRGVMKGKVGKSWSDEMTKVQKVIDFLGNAGVGH